MNISKDPKYPGFPQAVVLVVAAVGLQVGLAVPAAIVSLICGVRFHENPFVLGMISLMSFGSILAWGVWKTGVSGRELFPLRAVPGWVWPAVVLGQMGLTMLASDVDNWVRHLIPPPAFITSVFRRLAGGEGERLGSLFALVLVAPLTEEFFFRGLILRGLRWRYSPAIAIVLSSVLFGAMHLNPWQSFATLLMGGLLGWWAVRARSLWPCLAGHALNNAGVFWYRWLPFEIRGFNSSEMMGETVEFQPWWFDVLGLGLLVAGIILFCRAMPRERGEAAAVVTDSPSLPESPGAGDGSGAGSRDPG